MPRSARAAVGGLCYHVLNRGNGRATVFRQAADYRAFYDLLRESVTRRRMRLLAFCLMPNHFHAAVWPRDDGDLSRWMQWLMTTHVRRYHSYHETSGHLWQGRFKAFPIERDEHLLTVLRYIEQNPLRAGLVARAQDWRWSSLRERGRADAKTYLTDSPVPLPKKWVEWVNEPLTDKEAELARVRRCVNRGAPFGGERWTEQIAQQLGIEASLRPRGRPSHRKRREPHA